MNLTLDDARRYALVYDWDADAWAEQASTVPDEYTIEFQPAIDSGDLVSIANGREVYYEPRVVYHNEPFGTGYVSTPMTVYVQQLLPKPEAPPDGSTQTIT